MTLAKPRIWGNMFSWNFPGFESQNPTIFLLEVGAGDLAHVWQKTVDCSMLSSLPIDRKVLQLQPCVDNVSFDVRMFINIVFFFKPHPIFSCPF